MLSSAAFNDDKKSICQSQMTGGTNPKMAILFFNATALSFSRPFRMARK
jgi:hypothetical protein